MSVFQRKIKTQQSKAERSNGQDLSIEGYQRLQKLDHQFSDTGGQGRTQ